MPLETVNRSPSALDALREHPSGRRAVNHAIPLVSALLHLALQRAGVQGFEQLEATEELRRHAHDGAVVVEFATVVGSREHRDEDAVLEELVPILDYHVCPTDQVEVVPGEELSDNPLAKRVAHAPLASLPVLLLVGGIGP